MINTIDELSRTINNLEGYKRIEWDESKRKQCMRTKEKKTRTIRIPHLYASNSVISLEDVMQ
jgi:hypothetical protein